MIRFLRTSENVTATLEDQLCLIFSSTGFLCVQCLIELLGVEILNDELGLCSLNNGITGLEVALGIEERGQKSVEPVLK